MTENESFRFEEVDGKNKKSSQQLDWEENNLKFDDLFSPDDFIEKDEKLNINNQTPNIMETQKEFDQVEYLKNQMKYLGFGEGEKLHKDLEKYDGQ